MNTNKDQKQRTAILKIACPDREGLVAGVSSFVAKHHGNIINLDQYSDPHSGMFFMRIEWTLSDFSVKLSQILASLRKLADHLRLGNTWELNFSNHKIKVAIFASRYDHCLYDLLLRHKAGELNCEFPLIISNHDELEYVAKAFNVPFYSITTEDKAKAEKKQIALLKEYKIDALVLARYMQILSDDFIVKYTNKIINVHHSFLPAFTGAKPYHQAYERGVKVIGATAHFVTVELDEGPIIEQAVESISHKDTVAVLINKGRDLERKVLSRALQLFLEHRLFVSARRVIIF
jgi:formyltetrahydrofolate deformylase